MGKKKRDGFAEDDHLCDLKGQLKSHLDKYMRLVRDPTHVCRKCGRAARSPDRLCKPESL